MSPNTTRYVFGCRQVEPGRTVQESPFFLVSPTGDKPYSFTNARDAEKAFDPSNGSSIYRLSKDGVATLHKAGDNSDEAQAKEVVVPHDIVEKVFGGRYP